MPGPLSELCQDRQTKDGPACFTLMNPSVPPLSPSSSADSTRMSTIFISPITVVVTADVMLMTREWTKL